MARFRVFGLKSVNTRGPFLLECPRAASVMTTYAFGLALDGL